MKKLEDYLYSAIVAITVQKNGKVTYTYQMPDGRLTTRDKPDLIREVPKANKKNKLILNGILEVEEN